MKTNGDVAGAVWARLTFDEFLCFKEEEEEDGKIMHTERHKTFVNLFYGCIFFHLKLLK